MSTPETIELPTEWLSVAALKKALQIDSAGFQLLRNMQLVMVNFDTGEVCLNAHSAQAIVAVRDVIEQSWANQARRAILKSG